MFRYLYGKNKNISAAAAVALSLGAIGAAPALAADSGVENKLGTVTCTGSGAVLIADDSNSTQGINNTSRNIILTGSSSSADCLDRRIDKSRTDGRSIVGYSVSYTASLPSSSCALAGGTLSGTVDWVLDDDSIITNELTSEIPMANFLENVPGFGKLSSTDGSGLFEGTAFVSAAVLGNRSSNAQACATDAGVMEAPYDVHVTVLQPRDS